MKKFSWDQFFDEIVKEQLDKGMNFLEEKLKENPNKVVTFDSRIRYKKIGNGEYIIVEDNDKDEECLCFPIQMTSEIDKDQLKTEIYFLNSGNSFTATKEWKE